MLKIDLKITKHCIQTEAKKKYEALISKYFKKNTPEAEKEDCLKKIDALKFFLSNADINNLRSKYPELSGQTEIKACLCFPASYKEMYIETIDKKIIPEFS